MLFNRNLTLFSVFINFPCYSIGNMHFFAFLLISMLFNGKFAFCQFSMLFNGDLRLEKLWGGCMYGQTDGRMDVWKFTPVSYRTSALWGRYPKRKVRQADIGTLRENPHGNTIELQWAKNCSHILHHCVALRVSWSITDLCLSDFLPKCPNARMPKCRLACMPCMVRWPRPFVF